MTDAKRLQDAKQAIENAQRQINIAVGYLAGVQCAKYEGSSFTEAVRQLRHALGNCDAAERYRAEITSTQERPAWVTTNDRTSRHD